MNSIAASEIKTLKVSIYRYDPLKKRKALYARF